jgi:pimeloyl-ACP methyl ester carboxylesterase
MFGFNHQSGQFVSVDDAKIYYEELGAPSLPVLLMLHGGLGNIEIFNGVLPKLKDRFRIIGIDSRGQGKSTLGSVPLSYGLFQKEVQAVLQHLQITTLSVMGFSNGGTIAYRLAAFTPLKIQKLITIGSPWNVKHLEGLAQAYDELTLAAWMQHCQSDYEAYQKYNPEPDLPTVFSSLLHLGKDKSDDNFPNEQVNKIQTPVLAIRGEQDPVLSKENLQALARYIKGVKLVTLPQAGHEALKDQPDLFAEAVLSFLTAA